MSFLDGDFQATPEEMQGLTSKIEELKKVRKSIELYSEILEDLKKEEMLLGGEDVPALLTVMGVNSLEMTDGSKVSVKEDVHVSVPKVDREKREKVLTYLRENGGGGLIKEEISISSPGEEVLQALHNLGVSFTPSQLVNTNSVTAFVRGLLGMKKNTLPQVELSELPKELNAYILKKTVIKES